MVDIEKLCKGCMQYTTKNGKCARCGFDENEYRTMPHQLKPGTILAGKYMIGKILGEGGFGITYIGIDLNLNIRVAIKEYFPNGFVWRDVSNTDTVTIFSGSKQDFFEQGRDKFIEEAQSLAKFDNLPGIVSVKDFFLENGTSYIVMEYVEGETLKEYLARNGQRAEPEYIFSMMKPLMKSLAEIHKKGIIHRDISPDNIIIKKDLTVKLIDFGAACVLADRDIKDNIVQIKPGYAPEEQYRADANQGPWTDVYEFCATIYRAITGVLPQEATERVDHDTLKPPSELGVNIDSITENALMKGMAVFALDRFPNMEFLYNALYVKQNMQPQPQNKVLKTHEKQKQYDSKPQGNNRLDENAAHHYKNVKHDGTKRVTWMFYLIIASGIIIIISMIIVFCNLFARNRDIRLQEEILLTKLAEESNNKYNNMGYIDVSGKTIEDIADEIDMTVEEFLEEYDLPSDMPGNTNETAAFYTIPASRMAEMYGMDFATIKDTLQWGDEITETTTWGEAEGATKVGIYVGEDNLDDFKEYYGLGDYVTADTLWRDVRNIVDKQRREERIAGENEENVQEWD